MYKASSGDPVQMTDLWQVRDVQHRVVLLELCLYTWTPKPKLLMYALSVAQVLPLVQAVFIYTQADAKVVIPFLTHFADLTSWEYARKLVS